MCYIRWPTILLILLEVLRHSHQVFSEDHRIVSRKEGSSENSKYSVPESQPIIGIHNVTLLDSSQLPSEAPVPQSPDILDYIAHHAGVNFSSLLEPNDQGMNKLATRKPNVTIELPTENGKHNFSYLIEPNINDKTSDSESKLNKEIHVSPIQSDSYNSGGAELHSETSHFIYSPQVSDIDKFTTIFDSQNTFYPTLQPETEDNIQLTTTLNNYVQDHQKSTESSNVIQHIPISTGGKSQSASEHEIEVTTSFSKDENTLPDDGRFTTISVKPTVSTNNNFEPQNDVDVFQQTKGIKRVSVSESIISPRNSDQNIKNPSVVKPRLSGSLPNDGILVTSIHPNSVLHVTSSDMLPNFNISEKEVHPCARPCVEGVPPMICKYDFVLEWYYTMSKACYSCPLSIKDCDRKDCVVADGVRRPIAVVNRQLPGPSVEVCKGDRIIVDMENRMMEESTTIHWHGHHQRGTPYMDGVPYVTQCPIPPKSTFRYHYVADTPGTHFWHSHSGCQRADGAFGALIIRVPPTNDPHRDLYDRDLSEHLVQILDWDHKLGVDKFLAHHHANGNNKPITLLVNGRGRFHQFKNADDNIENATISPTAKFTVQKGLRYRFRLINAGFLNCPIELSVDNHTITVISSDGSDLKPVEADSLVSYAGERFDFVLNANMKIGNYWMRFRGLMDCDERFTQAHQVAILQYEGAPKYEEPPGEVSYNASRRKGLQINSLNVGIGTDDSLVIPELNSTAEDDESLMVNPDMTFYLSYDFYKIDNPHYHRAPYYGYHQVPFHREKLTTPQLNHISLKLPPFPLLSQHSDLGSQYHFCNETTVQNCSSQYCECTHVIQVPLGAVLELILVDKGVTFDANHPFHLHGHAFRVVAMQRLGSNTTVEEVQRLDKAGMIHRKLSGAPIKDTVTVPDGGFTIVRVHASNPGYWLFHCHIEFHVELGMAVVFKVGEHEDFARSPRGFPKCNNYMPPENGYEEETDNEIESPVISITHWWPFRANSSSVSVRSLFLPLITMLILSLAVR